MTTYTTITDTQVDPEAPITSELMSALRDNPIAITEGSSGAPQIQTAAIQDSAVTTAKIANNNVTAAKIPIGTSSASQAAGPSASVNFNHPSSSHLFLPTWTSDNNSLFEGTLLGNGIKLTNVSGNSGTVTITWRYIAA